MDEGKRKELWAKVQDGTRAMAELKSDLDAHKNEKGIEDQFLNTANWPILLEAAKTFLGFFGGLIGGIFGWNRAVAPITTKDGDIPAPRGFWDTIQQIWAILNLIYQFLQQNSLTAEEFKAVIEQAKSDIRDDVAASIPGQLRRMGAKVETKMTFENVGDDGK